MKPKTHARPVHAGPLITLLLGAAALAYVFLVFLPVQKSIGRIQHEVRSKRDFLVQTNRVQQTILETEQQLQRTNEFNASRQETAPTPAQLSGFYARVLDSAQAAGVKTARFDPGAPLVLETMQRHPLEMEIEGNFAQVFEFVSQLESLKAPMWVEEMNIEPLGEDRERLQCEIKMAVFAARAENSD